MDKLIFTETTNITIATNNFMNVPIILQYETTPLIKIIKQETAGFTTEIPIYHSDGTYLAKAVGSRLFLTPQGEKAGLSLTYPDKMTICKLGEKVLFEIEREEAASLKTRAELFTPDGNFVKITETPELFDTNGDSIKLKGLILRGNNFKNIPIGILIKKDGSISIGVF